jgi:hypothetical protein
MRGGSESKTMKFKLTLILLSSLSFIVHFGYSMEWGEQSIYPRRCFRFTASEDARLIELVREYGTDAWQTVAKYMSGRTVRQCRERWNHYLDPCLNSLETNGQVEVDQIKALIYRLGQAWVLPSVIRKKVNATYGGWLSLAKISKMLAKAKREGWHQEMAIIHRMEAPAARDPLPPPQAQPPALDPQPGDQSFTDLNRQWGLMDEQEGYGGPEAWAAYSTPPF